MSIRRGEWEDCSGGGRKRELYFTLPDGREVKFNDLPVGACWEQKDYPDDCYLSHRHGPFVVLPGKEIWDMTAPGSDGTKWTLTGEIPNITAHPSINCVGRYHGWVRDGHVSDDVDGRKFNDDGLLIK